MSEPAFDTLDAARRLKAAGLDSEHAEAIVEVMGQSVNQLVTRAHFDAGISKLGTELHARIDTVLAELHARIGGLESNLHTRIDGVESDLQSRIGSVESNLQSRIGSVESNLQSLEATMRTEIMRAVLIVLGVLIPVIGLMMAVVEFYSARGGGA